MNKGYGEEKDSSVRPTLFTDDECEYFFGIFCLAVLIVSPTLSFGITFDIWETGMSIHEVAG
jgi:hypothetical protein